MFEYTLLSPIDALMFQLTNWKKRANLIEVDSLKMRKLGLRPGDHISASQMAAIAKTPMAVI